VSGQDDVRVRVPASSANLGPGFDVLGAALALDLELQVAKTGSFAMVTDLDVRVDRDNLAVRAFERLLPADEFEFRMRSQIPLSGGLGSSAAAVLAGLLAAQALRGESADVLALATEIEGHPDNVAAALRGGIAISDAHGVTSFPAPDGLTGILVVPPTPVRTSEARAALPATVPLGDAVANMASIARLTLGLARGDFELIAAGLSDRLHQPYRAHLYPRSAALLERAQAFGALGATISGAGPTVLVWTTTANAGAVTAALQAELGQWADVLPAPFTGRGAGLLDVH
jgi:homoserine kinase